MTVRLVRGSSGIAVVALVVLLSTPAAAASPVDRVDETRDYAEDVAGTCTAPDNASRCRRWASRDVPAWTLEYVRRTGDWSVGTADDLTAWSTAYLADVRAWADGAPEHLQRYPDELAAWAGDTDEREADANELVNWSDDTVDHYSGVLPSTGGWPYDPYIEWSPPGLTPDSVPELDPPVPALPPAPEHAGLVPGLPPAALPPAPERPPRPGADGPSDGGPARKGPLEPTTTSRHRTDDVDPSEPGDPTAAGSAAHVGQIAVPAPHRPGGLVAALLVTGLLTSLLGAVKLLRFYLRVTKDDALDHDLRAAIVDVVRDRPAINATRIADVVGIARTTARYHTRVLERTGHLVARRVGQEKVFYVRGRHPPEDKDALYAVRHPTKQALLDILVESPGLSLAEIGRQLDRDRSTIKHHADELADLGLLDDRRDGRCRRMGIHERAEGAVRRALDRPSAVGTDRAST